MQFGRTNGVVVLVCGQNSGQPRREGLYDQVQTVSVAHHANGRLRNVSRLFSFRREKHERARVRPN